jgi:hypothetical protein
MRNSGRVTFLPPYYWSLMPHFRYLCAVILHPLHLPKAALKLSRQGEKLFVWCILRRKTLLLTPEEWVRQHVIHFLINDKNVPQGLIASELGIRIHQLNRRCDVVVYGRDQKARLLVECKAPEVVLTQQVLQQIAHYNWEVGVDVLWVTNGIDHAVYRIDRETKQIVVLEGVPDFEELG